MTKHTEASSTERALKMALEALVKALPDMPVHTDWHLEAITALREALTSVPDWASEAKEQPAPVQQCMEHGECFGGECIYPATQPAQQQEPVYWQWRRKDQPWSLEYTFNSEVQVTTKDSERRALYTSPPAQRKPLTDEELVDVASNCGMNGLNIHGYTFARAIEVAHGIKGDA